MIYSFFELMSESQAVRADIGAIVVQIDKRGAGAVLDDDDIKLGKQLFTDLEQVVDHLKGLDTGDPTYLYDAAGYITAETASGMLFTYDSMGRGYQFTTSSTSPFDALIYLTPFLGIALIRLGKKAKKHKLDIIGLLTVGSVVLLIVMASRPTNAQINVEQVYYYHLDHLGTPIMMTDQNQNVVWTATYDPFGQATISAATVTNNLRFPGMYADTETGLYYNMNRYYYPAIGRYIEPDPMLQPMVNAQLKTGPIFNELLTSFATNPQSLNEYAYGTNNTLLLIDPFGLWYITVGGGYVAGSIGIDTSIITIDKSGVHFNPQYPSVSFLFPPQLPGGGTTICWHRGNPPPSLPTPPPNNECNKGNPPPEPPLEPEPLIWSAGAGRYSGISVSDDLNTICINVGSPTGFPVTTSLPTSR